MRGDRSGRGGPRHRAAAGARRHRGAGRGGRGRPGPRHVEPEQRGHPCRDPLSRRQPEGAALRGGQAAALRLLRRAGHSASADGQADRCRRRAGGADPGRHPRQGAGQRGRRPGNDRPRGRSRPGAGARRGRGAGFAVDGDHRQPRADDGAAGRCASRRGGLRLPRAGAGRTAGGARGAARFRRGAGGLFAERRSRGQRRRAFRAPRRRIDRRRA